VLCILYVNAVGLCLGLVGMSIERLLPATVARRWLWCIVIPISFFLPGIYRFRHSLAVAGSAPELIESHNSAIGDFSLLASAFVVCWGLTNALRVGRAISVARRRRRDDGEPEVLHEVPVVVTDSLGPATVGFWRSRVLVPKWVLAMPAAQRQYVVRHEEEHRSAYDAHILFIASLGLILAPWNLALWWQLRRLYLAIEIDCDNRVVKRLGNPNAYGELLLKVAQAENRGLRMQPALLGGVGSLERRLTALLDPSPIRRFQRFLLPALALVLLFFVVITPHPVMPHRSHAHAATAASTAHVQPSSRR
jgi:hypothetical protein